MKKTCKSCVGTCCIIYNISVSQKEAKKISKHTGRIISSFCKPFPTNTDLCYYINLKKRKVTIKGVKSSFCIFFDPKNKLKCKIYPVRPECCINYLETKPKERVCSFHSDIYCNDKQVFVYLLGEKFKKKKEK